MCKETLDDLIGGNTKPENLPPHEAWGDNFGPYTAAAGCSPNAASLYSQGTMLAPMVVSVGHKPEESVFTLAALSKFTYHPCGSCLCLCLNLYCGGVGRMG